MELKRKHKKERNRNEKGLKKKGEILLSQSLWSITCPPGKFACQSHFGITFGSTVLLCHTLFSPGLNPLSVFRVGCGSDGKMVEK